MITRLKFLQAAAAACFGVIDGKEVEIPCPENLERCPFEHQQEPLERINLSIVADEGSLAEHIVISICSKCGVLYANNINRPEPKK